jgi:hypothetical protein
MRLYGSENTNLENRFAQIVQLTSKLSFSRQNAFLYTTWPKWRPVYRKLSFNLFGERKERADGEEISKDGSASLEEKKEGLRNSI